MSNVPLRRRVWFFWTVFNLAAGVLLSLAFVAALVFVAARSFHIGNYAGACMSLSFAVGVLFVLFVRFVIFRYNFRVGMQRELRRRNCCPSCSYDLRSSPLRCPECGHSMPIANIEV